jgi:spore maturation protein CgeB
MPPVARHPVRLLIATPLRPGRTKVGLNMGTALAELGHSVEFFDYDDRPPLMQITPRVLRGQDWPARQRDYVNRRLLDRARAFRPDVFLAVKALQIHPETVGELAAMGIRTVGYWIDDPIQSDRSLALAPAYQHYFTNDASSLARYRDAGLVHVHHLPSSADTRMFRPLANVRPFADVIFVGTRTDRREEILGRLQDFDMRVYGPGWRKSSLRRSCVYPEAFGSLTNRVYNSARINLNIHAWFGHGSAMNLRLFEVPAAGAFLLTDWVAEIDAAYVDGEHLACWRDLGELREKIAYYLAHEAERRRIARQGREHFLRNHAYTTRVETVLAIAFAQT